MVVELLYWCHGRGTLEWETGHALLSCSFQLPGREAEEWEYHSDSRWSQKERFGAVCFKTQIQVSPKADTK